jgi:hypothetical protein
MRSRRRSRITVDSASVSVVESAISLCSMLHHETGQPQQVTEIRHYHEAQNIRYASDPRNWHRQTYLRKDR